MSEWIDKWFVLLIMSPAIITAVFGPPMIWWIFGKSWPTPEQAAPPWHTFTKEDLEEHVQSKKGQA